MVWGASSCAGAFGCRGKPLAVTCRGGCSRTVPRRPDPSRPGHLRGAGRRRARAHLDPARPPAGALGETRSRGSSPESQSAAASRSSFRGSAPAPRENGRPRTASPARRVDQGVRGRRRAAQRTPGSAPHPHRGGPRQRTLRGGTHHSLRARRAAGDAHCDQSWPEPLHLRGGAAHLLLGQRRRSRRYRRSGRMPVPRQGDGSRRCRRARPLPARPTASTTIPASGDRRPRPRRRVEIAKEGSADTVVWNPVPNSGGAWPMSASTTSSSSASGCEHRRERDHPRPRRATH